METVKISNFMQKAELLYSNRKKPFMEFDKALATSVYKACEQAIQDNRDGIKTFRTVSAPTGGGKSSFAYAYLKTLLDQGCTSMFVVPTTRQVNEAFIEIRNLVGATNVACWSGDHQKEYPVDDRSVLDTKDFVPNARFYRSDLSKYPIIVITHSLYKSLTPDLKIEGKHRDLVVIDEKPEAVLVFDVLIHQICATRDAIRATKGDLDPTYITVDKVFQNLDQMWQGANKKAERYNSLVLPEVTPMDVAVIHDIFEDSTQLKALAKEVRVSEEEMRKVFGLILSISEGYAFIANRENSNGALFVGYRFDLPLRSGSVLLDATAEIDGINQIVGWSKVVPSAPADYRNLTIKLLDVPSEIGNKNFKKLYGHWTTRTLLLNWMRESVLQNTKAKDKVLIVSNKDLIIGGELKSMDWEGRTVSFVHYGTGVGSNQWKDYKNVFMFGQFHKPQSAYISEGLGLKEEKFTTDSVAGISPRKLTGEPRVLRDGHLLSWLKQLSTRGSARNLVNGIAEPMNLFVSHGYQLLVERQSLIFPNSPTVVLPKRGFSSSAMKRTPTERLIILLDSCGGDVLPLTTVTESDPVLRTNIHKYLEDPALVSYMTQNNWEYVPGKGRYSKAAFKKITNPFEGITHEEANAEALLA
jgi:hypothetical protein